MASFRNLLDHRYEKIDDEVVYGIIKKRLSDFHDFVGQVEKWIKTHPDS
jgi:uncharacterized protein YutE (UPF0331/DUF86 family)